MKTLKIPEWLLLTIIVAVGTTLRILCASNGDFWLDEIWSYNTAFEQHSLLRILYFNHDNNHLLNTIFIHLVGPGKNIFIYRILPLLCGTLSLLVVYFTPVYKDRAEKFITVTIFSVSYFFVAYSSEARGYAYLIFFLSVSFYLLNKIFNEPQKKLFYALFWLVSILGILSHYLYVTFYVAGFIWAISYKKRISIILKMYLVPSIFYTIIYFALLKNLHRGGGDFISAVKISELAFKELLGFAIPAFACFFIYLYAIVSKPKKDESGIFYISIFMLVPMAMLILMKDDVIYERYMTSFLFFFVFIISELIARLVNARSNIAKISGLILIMLIIIGSVQKDIKLYIYGRGNYATAVDEIIKNSNKKDITIATDHGFRNEVVLKFYLAKIKTGKPNIHFSYINKDLEQKADWLIYHRIREATDKNPDDTMSFGSNDIFKLFKVYKYDQGLSGWEWVIYKRI